jgi:hypothetical protein
MRAQRWKGGAEIVSGARGAFVRSKADPPGAENTRRALTTAKRAIVMATAMRTLYVRHRRRNRCRHIHAQFRAPCAALDDERDDAIMLTPPGKDAP